ncbi:MAG: hypothetical protein N2234_09375 [Planctomycetota bacterium]|nr:hypothetical protein [Planctomycetota bacterium]
MRIRLLILSWVVVVGCSSKPSFEERYEHGKAIGERLEETLATYGFRIREIQIFPVDPVEPCPAGMKRDVEERLLQGLRAYITKTAKWTLYVTRITYNEENPTDRSLTIEAKLEDYEGRCAWRETVERREKLEAAGNEKEIQRRLVAQCCEEIQKRLPLTKVPVEKVKE